MPVGDDSALYKRQNLAALLAAHADGIAALRAELRETTAAATQKKQAKTKKKGAAPGAADRTAAATDQKEGGAAAGAAAKADDAASDSILPAAPVNGVAFDDVFLLRYILSHKTAAAAAPHVRATLAWRAENADVLARLGEEGRRGIPHADTFLKFQTVGDTDMRFGGWTTFVVRTAHSDLPALMSALTVKQVSDYLTFSKELQWRECDRLSRETNVLVKNLSIIDMNGFSFFGADRRFFKALGDSSKQSAVLYPQLLGATICVNAPSFMQLLVSAFSPFFPKSFLDKQRFCKVKNSETEPASKCPYLNMFGGQDAAGKTVPVPGLPDFLGGVAPCPAVLVPVADRADRLSKVTVSARSSHRTEIQINAATMMGLAFPCTVKYEVLVAAYGVSVGAKMDTAEDGEADALPARKIKAEEGLVQGTFTVARPGRLLIELDNSYSMLRSKTVQFRFDIANDVGTDGAAAEGAGGETKAADVQVSL